MKIGHIRLDLESIVHLRDMEFRKLLTKLTFNNAKIIFKNITQKATRSYLTFITNEE